MDRTGLDPRQNALASAIVEFSKRRWLTARWLIEQQLNKPFTELQPEMCGVLLSGATQLLFLDGVPAYAAINESVEWAKQMIRPGAGRMVNAVLRKVAGLIGETPERAPSWSVAALNQIPLPDGSAIVLRSDVMPADERLRFGVATSCPSALYQSMLRSLTEEQVRAIALHNMLQAPTVLNITHAQSPIDTADLTPHEQSGFAVFGGSHAALDSLLNAREDVWAQDAASGQAVRFAARQRPDPGVIIDLCAGMGTKTRQLAAVFPEARIVATDTNESRRQTLRSVFRATDRVLTVDPAELSEWLGRSDLLVLDVPCSNTGTLARRVEARYRATDATFESLVAVQKQIIADSIPLLAPSGTLLYSTCSIDPRENHQQAAWAASQHRLRIDQEQMMLPSGGPGQPAIIYTDGSYAAALTRG